MACLPVRVPIHDLPTVRELAPGLFGLATLGICVPHKESAGEGALVTTPDADH